MCSVFKNALFTDKEVIILHKNVLFTD